MSERKIVQFESGDIYRSPTMVDVSRVVSVQPAGRWDRPHPGSILTFDYGATLLVGNEPEDALRLVWSDPS